MSKMGACVSYGSDRIYNADDQPPNIHSETADESPIVTN
jgi:hypothetical protein